MDNQEIVRIIEERLLSFNPLMIGIFGSFARNEMKDDSDVDILVKFSKSPSLLKLIDIENQLSALIGRKVDLVTEGSLRNSRIRSSINKDIKIIYQA